MRAHLALFAATLVGCNADSSSLLCGAGTVEVNGACTVVPVPPPCGPGTHNMGGVCAPDSAGFEIRVIATEMPADPFAKIPVLAIGTRSDGGPALDEVVFNTSRAGAGTFSPASATLTPLGTTAFYTPCSTSTPGCVGPVTLTLALATAPREVVASVDIELQPQDGVGSAMPCLVGGNVRR